MEYEIQKNITNILDVLTTRHDDINLIAVEGGSGIIPTLELATIPDSAAKRAVADYFMRQGKLTGADYLAIMDRPDLELYGAEDARLYTKSHELIQRFTTEENRGLVLEILDQLAFLQEESYNPALLAFEQRRRHYLKSDTDADEYLRALIREAEKAAIDPLPKAWQRANRRRELNIYEKNLQQQYLENALRTGLFTTDKEREIYQYQTYMELAERAINVSVGREDLKAYQALAAKISLKKIMEVLKQNVGEMFFDFSDEIKQLEIALQQALRFYQFADQRDQALYQNAARRGRDRQEDKIILITGGYHTDAIARQIKKAGHSSVVIQPEMSKVETDTRYFELLRNPDQPTEFERLLAGQFVKPEAMAVLDFLCQAAFRMQFKEMVVFVQGTMTEMRKKGILKSPGMTLKWIRHNLVTIETPGNIMGMLFKRQHTEILDSKSMQRYVGEPGSDQLRIGALALLVASLAVISMALTGVSVAAGVVGTTILMAAQLGLGISVMAGLFWFGEKYLKTIRAFFRENSKILKKSIVIGTMLLALMLMPPIAGPAFTDAGLGFLSQILGDGTAYAAMAPGVLELVQNITGTVLANTPGIADLNVYAKNPDDLFKITSFLSGAASIRIIGYPAKDISVGLVNLLKRYEPSTSVPEAIGKMAKINAEKVVQQRLGKGMKPEEIEESENTWGVVTAEQIEEQKRISRSNGLNNYEASSLVMKNYERQEKANPGIASMPISSVFIPEGDRIKLQVNLPLLQFVNDKGEVLEELKAIPETWLKAVLDSFNIFKVLCIMEIQRRIINNVDKLKKTDKETGRPKENIVDDVKDLLRTCAEKYRDIKFEVSETTYAEIIDANLRHEKGHGPNLHIPPEKTNLGRLNPLLFLDLFLGPLFRL